MKYKNKYYRKIKNTYPLEVSCLHCKSPIAIYAKAGRGNLIKIQLPRIIESQIDLDKSIDSGQLVCHKCGQELARKGDYKGNITFWVLRGNISSRRLDGYRI